MSTTPLLSSEPVLQRIFSDLRIRNDDQQEKAALELREHVITVSREFSGEPFTKFLIDVNKRIWELIHSSDVNDKLGGILAIDLLIDVDVEENTKKITRFANYIRAVLPGTEKKVTYRAAQALGKLVLLGGGLIADLVEFEVKRALEWLQADRNEQRRHAAAVVLKELAINVPTLLYAYVPQILDLVWIVLRDPKVALREAGIETLNACLKMVEYRESQLRRQWYRKIFDEAQKGMKHNTTEAIHGSLLTFKELLIHTGKSMDSSYDEMCETILKYKTHRDILIRKTVIQLIPAMAAFDPKGFSTKYLKESMGFLVSRTKRDKDNYAFAFVAIGQVSIEVKSEITPYLGVIFADIMDGLPAKGRPSSPANEAAVFDCIGMLARGVGPAMEPFYSQNLLDMMFGAGLSEPLRGALVEVSEAVPSLNRIIQEKLLSAISIILCEKTYQHPGAPFKRSLNAGISALHMEVPDNESLLLALSTLSNFQFTDYLLKDMIKTIAETYLDHENPDIRRSAAVTCIYLLVRDPCCYQTSNASMQIVNDVLARLLVVGITDPEPTIRLAVLSNLNEQVDLHLAQAAHIRALFIAFNDETFEIRNIAISIIGRLSVINPAHVMPSLRKSLIHLLTELEFSNVPRHKEESARLLSQLISVARHLIKPYVEPILKVLLLRARDPNPGVVSHVLLAIGELSQVGCEALISHMDELIPVIIETLQDQSSPAKREAALLTLGQLASSTGFVVDPYLKYPSLLDIMISILKSEQNPAIRREAVKAMGVIGALDPYRHKITSSGTGDASSSNTAGADILLPPGLGQTSEEYYPVVVINSLMKILRDSSLATYHTAVIQAVMYMFKTLGLKCVPFLPQIIPTFLAMMKSSPTAMLDFHFQQLGLLVTIVKQHIRSYLPDIFAVIQEFWNPKSTIQITIISVIEAVALAMDAEFKVYLRMFLPRILDIFESDETERKQPTQKALHALIVFGSHLEEYLHLVAPVMVKLIERRETILSVRKAAIQTVGQLCKQTGFAEQASRLMHALIRVLASQNAELRGAVMDTLANMVCALKSGFVIFVPMVDRALARYGIQHQRYVLLVDKITANEPIPEELLKESNPIYISDDSPQESIAKKLPLNQENLRKAWEASQRSSKDDWIEWTRRFSVELLRESPSHSLRSCADLAGQYYPLARELFNAAFVSCWNELEDTVQDELVRALETALTSSTIPPEILQSLLNLAEFMEHDDKALPIDVRTLGGYAAKCHAYAKALHYKELEYVSEHYPNTIEALISINNQLQLPDSATGMLVVARSTHTNLKESWYEKLQRWEDGLQAYNSKLASDPHNADYLLGRMRCLHNLGEWETLAQAAQQSWESSSVESQKAIAPLGAAAAWGMQQWDSMGVYINAMKDDSPDKTFFMAILALHRDNYVVAVEFINKTRELLDTELTALVAESYNRAYPVVVRNQMLVELEEIIQYKQTQDINRKTTIRQMWRDRLKGCQRNVDVWQRILKVRALVVSPKTDMEMWIKFANLCRKNGKFNLAQKTLYSLFEVEPTELSKLDTLRNPSPVVYAALKLMWAKGQREHAHGTMKIFVKGILDRLGVSTLPEILSHVESSKNDPHKAAVTKLLARCYLKLGTWQAALNEDRLSEAIIPDILKSHMAATSFDKNSYKAWHAWALANFDVLSYYEKLSENTNTQYLVACVLPAIQGFVRSIALSKSNSLQDILRLLTLWFKYGYVQDVNMAIADGFNDVGIDTWLQVIPQLIARIHFPFANVRKLVHQLLTEIGRVHPQALVYSLTVASKSMVSARTQAATTIMDKMRTHSPGIVDHALLVSKELIRVAILWHELWHEGLEDASRQWFGERNVEAMFQTLEPLHQMLEAGPETLREISFIQAFGRDLQEAHDWCRRFRRSNNPNDLNQAWEVYSHVFRRINKQLPQLTNLELQYVAPKLLAARDLELAVPGTYKSGEPVVKIGSFSPTLTVIMSKQRPRRLTIRGSDGKDYQFLLKGHEDLRQDERVMQLFGLVNNLLTADAETMKRHLNIQGFSVVPLSPNSGLIGWVPFCDTLHSLIRDYRESRKILLNIEHRLILQMAPEFDHLTKLQKVEVFDYALENTTGQDLAKVLWLKSKTSEIWLDRRTTYTRSLAVMSMVGYILGLGDRHPSNLMLDRFTGKVIHIDFGDCFEVAMQRDKFPEKIPFRLTRMLIQAMEVCGIEGNFRITCENVMRVLREHKDSLMAVLEAFVYDPLINWRLNNNASPRVDSTRGIVGPGEGEEQSDDLRRNIPARRPRSHTDGDQQQPPQATDDNPQREPVNAKAMAVINRVTDKLTGRDFKPTQTLDVRDQVQQLIEEATSSENLCQCFIGWCAFW